MEVTAYKEIATLTCLSPFITIPKKHTHVFCRCVSPLGWWPPKYDGSSNLSQLLTVSCLAITMSILQVIMGRGSRRVKKNICSIARQFQCLASQSKRARKHWSTLPPIFPLSHIVCLCRHWSPPFRAATLTRVFNFILSHPFCQGITILFTQILCKEL